MADKGDPAARVATGRLRPHRTDMALGRGHLFGLSCQLSRELHIVPYVFEEAQIDLFSTPGFFPLPDRQGSGPTTIEVSIRLCVA